MEIGRMTLSQASPYLDLIASSYGLRLNRAKEFKLARFILANLYCREMI